MIWSRFAAELRPMEQLSLGRSGFPPSRTVKERASFTLGPYLCLCFIGTDHAYKFFSSRIHDPPNRVKYFILTFDRVIDSQCWCFRALKMSSSILYFTMRGRMRTDTLPSGVPFTQIAHLWNFSMSKYPPWPCDICTKVVVRFDDLQF
jgi:hypothetical protein